MSQNYPRSVEEVLDPEKKYKPAVLRAVKAFRARKPWRGTVAERQEKFRKLYAALAEAYQIAEPCLIFEANEQQGSGASCFVPASRTIILRGRLSVVSALHEWAHFLFGFSEKTACSWSINLFCRCFPKSWARVQFDGHMIRSRGEQP